MTVAETADAVRNDLWAPFHEGAEAGRLTLPYCVQTERPFWPPSPVSPFVTAGAVDWRPHPPEGTLIARVTYRRGFQKAFEARLPYAVGLVELTSGLRLQVHLGEPDAPQSPQAGARIRLGFARLVDGGAPVLIGETAGS